MPQVFYYANMFFDVQLRIHSNCWLGPALDIDPQQRTQALRQGLHSHVLYSRIPFLNFKFSMASNNAATTQKQVLIARELSVISSKTELERWHDKHSY